MQTNMAIHSEIKQPCWRRRTTGETSKRSIKIGLHHDIFPAEWIFSW